MTLPVLVKFVYDKLLRLSRQFGQGSLGGLLGLALLLVGFYQIRSARGNRPRSSQQQQQQQGAGSSRQAPPQQAATTSLPASALQAAAGPSTSAAAALASSSQQQQSQQQQRQQDVQKAAARQAVPAGVRARLAGLNKVSISVAGVLLHEWAAHELSDSATLRSELVPLLQQIMAVADVYLIAHVEDDVGQAAVTGALESEGLLGHGPCAAKPHHLLFCSTLEGKVSIVRQLEPDLHIDGHTATLQELQRFMPQLLYIAPPSNTAPCEFGANVAQYGSLQAWVGL